MYRGVIYPQDIVADTDLCRSGFPFDSVWFLASPAYWQDQIDFEERSRQVRGDVAACILCGWHNVKIRASPPYDRTQLYVGVNNIG